MKKPNPELTDEDNPEWTQEDFAHARPAREIHPEWAAESAQLKRSRHKIVLSSRINHEIVRKRMATVNVAKGSDGRTRDLSGEIRRKNGDTRVDTLRKTYGDEFGREVRGDAKLDTLLKRTGSRSLSDYLKKSIGK